MWTLALSVLFTSANAAICPEKYPFAYFNGKYCCFSAQEKKDTENDPLCTGANLELSSKCCANDHFTACDENDATELCTNNVQGKAYRLNDGALDSSEIECGQCRAGQECRYCAEDGKFQCQLGIIARNAVIGIFAGLAALLLILLIIWCCCCKKGKERFEPTYLEPKPKPEPIPVPPPIVPPSSSSTSPEPTPEPSREPTPIPAPVLVQNAPSSSSESSSESEAEIAEPEILVEAAQDSPPPTPSPTPTPTPTPTPPPPIDDPLLPIPDANTAESSVTDHAVSGDEAITESGVGLGEMRPAIEAELVDLSRHNVTEFKWSEAQTTDTEAVQNKVEYDSPASE